MYSQPFTRYSLLYCGCQPVSRQFYASRAIQQSHDAAQCVAYLQRFAYGSTKHAHVDSFCQDSHAADGVWDYLSWIALAVPVVCIGGIPWVRQRRVNLTDDGERDAFRRDGSDIDAHGPADPEA